MDKYYWKLILMVFTLFLLFVVADTLSSYIGTFFIIENLLWIVVLFLYAPIHLLLMPKLITRDGVGAYMDTGMVYYLMASLFVYAVLVGILIYAMKKKKVRKVLAIYFSIFFILVLLFTYGNFSHKNASERNKEIATKAVDVIKEYEKKHGTMPEKIDGMAELPPLLGQQEYNYFYSENDNSYYLCYQRIFLGEACYKFSNDSFTTLNRL